MSVQEPVKEVNDPEESADDFEQYVKHKQKSPYGFKMSPKKSAIRVKTDASSPIRAHLYRSAEALLQSSPRRNS